MTSVKKHETPDIDISITAATTTFNLSITIRACTSHLGPCAHCKTGQLVSQRTQIYQIWRSKRVRESNTIVARLRPYSKSKPNSWNSYRIGFGIRLRTSMSARIEPDSGFELTIQGTIEPISESDQFQCQTQLFPFQFQRLSFNFRFRLFQFQFL